MFTTGNCDHGPPSGIECLLVAQANRFALKIVGPLPGTWHR